MFTQRDDNELFSYKRIFREEERFPNGNPLAASVQAQGMTLNDDIETLITVDQRPEQMLVCLMHDPRNRGANVSSNIEQLATIIYNEANALHQQSPVADNTERKNGFSSISGFFKRMANKINPNLDPKQFRFFVYMPPSSSSTFGKEQFLKADMAFKDGAFKDLQWTHYDVVPPAIKQAHLDSMTEIRPAPLKVLNHQA
jgi:hypothetical protein